MDDDDEMLVCESCDFRFTVIWQNDAWRSATVRQGLPVIEFCPSCGEALNED